MDKINRELIILVINSWITKKNSYSSLEDLSDLIDDCMSVHINSTDLYDEDKAAKEEIKLLYNLFNKYPYYKILNVLDLINTDFLELSYRNKNCKKIFPLIKGYLEELTPTIERRMVTEINIHIYYLARKFYKEHTIYSDDTKKILKKNLYSPEVLIGYTFLENEENYVQESFFFLQIDSFRDRISKKNYELYEHSQKNLRLVTKYLTSSEFEDFAAELKNILEELKKEDSAIEKLFDMIFDIIITIEKRYQRIIQESKKLELLKYLE